MESRPLSIGGAYVFTPPVFRDDRGLFVSPYQDPAFVETIGHSHVTAQTNINVSARGVVRGIHYTRTPPGQAKYVYCVHGRALDVVVDLRVGSPTFGAWDAVEMDGDNFVAMYFPVGVGHTFIALEDHTAMSYLVTSPYEPANELAVHPLDPQIGLPWPEGLETHLSERDRLAPTLAQARDAGLLPRWSECGPPPIRQVRPDADRTRGEST